jgi:hypothetical protein
MIIRFLFTLGALCTLPVTTNLGAVAEAKKFAPEQLDFFEEKIRPVLAEQCFKCHSTTGEKIKGGLVLDTREATIKGGDTGPGVVVGDPNKSLIIEAIRYSDEDLQMPPKHRLSPEQVKDFEEWVRMGLPDPRDGTVKVVLTPSDNLDEARKFWSLQPVKESPVPEVKDSGWARNDIDRFLLAKLEERGFMPNKDVERRMLLRRATYDLIGLPPTPEEVESFLADETPEAFAKVIDRLLDSPRYGERWGRHWLDVVRYADTSGCNSDFPVPSAHRYRDYVIESFNRDKPYDQFLREQIAGDLLPAASDPERFEKTIATGYLAISRRFGSRANEFHLTIDDTLDNLGKAVLGLSIGCARCHDHKYDPVSARDYYALYGIFESTKYAFPGTEIYRHTKDFIPLAPKEEAEAFMAEAIELAGLDDKVESLKNEIKRLQRDEEREKKLASEPFDPAQPVLAEFPKPQRRTSTEAAEELNATKKRQEELVQRQERLPKAFAVSEGKSGNARLQKKGDPRTLGEGVPRGFLTVLGGQVVPEEEKGSGRAQLAEWLTQPENPLTPRVMVNRIWQNHFGTGIVESSNDFGARGERPTHPELLDWLAKRFVDAGWSVKAMHRLIMSSRAYQMSCADNAEQSLADVNNDTYWRFNRRRLSAEEIRDSILYVSGELDLSSAGAHPFPKEAEWDYSQHRPFIADYPTKKRSVYLMQQRIRKQPFLEIFDGADTNATTAVRPVSTTPIQSLFLLNNELAYQQAASLAERVNGAGNEAARIDTAYRLVLGRPAQEEEINEANDYIASVAEALKQTDIPPDHHTKTAVASFARVLLSSNEFLFVE